MHNPTMPTARKEGLVVQELSGEVLVYDLDSNKAHCLNETAALIWNACDGKNSFTKTIKDIERRTGDRVSEDLIRLAIDQLSEKNLLSEKAPRAFEGQNRRQVLKKIGFASVVALPIVASLTAPTAALAVACSGVVMSCIGCGDGTPCDVDGDMTIGNCVAGFCAGD